MSVKKSVNVLKYPGQYINCFLKDGKLSPGYSTSSILGACPPYFVSVVFSKICNMYLIGGDEEFYTSKGGATYTTYPDFDCYSPFLIEDCVMGENKAIYITGPHAAVYNGKGFDKYVLKTFLHCGVLHCGRLFGASEYTLKWSGPNGFNDWSGDLNGSGQLQLDPARGIVLNMLEFRGKLIAVREYGLTVLNMYGAPENFSVEITDTDSCERVFQDTACIIEDKLYFFTATGLKYFDGSKITPVKLQHTVTSAHGAVAYDGRYFTICYSDKLRRKMVLCVDVESSTSCLIFEETNAIFIEGGVHLMDSISHRMLRPNGRFSFESKAIDFDTDRYKTVTEIKIPCEGDMKVGISNGRHLKVYNVSQGHNIIRPHMRGKSFTVTLEGNEELKDVTITAEVTDGV